MKTWVAFDAWRKSGDIGRNSNIRRALPGLGVGTAAFVVALAIEAGLKLVAPAKEDVHH
eukprot:m.137870 g.137870  ORF g.137870 m.137870 type:complete len:59 (-) comp22703_c0_seq1:1232-1408(-)